MRRKLCRRKAAVLAAGLALVAGRVLAQAGLPGDDLQVVKQAVAQAAPEARPSAKPTPVPAPAPAARPGTAPQWVRLRVEPKGEHGDRVSINLPIGVVRSLGGWSIDLGRCADADGRRCKLRLAEVLEALDSGQSLVEVENEREKVRIWVE